MTTDMTENMVIGEPPKPAVIILAAGRASRFGSPKQLAYLQGKRLLSITLRVASKVSDQLILVTGAYASQIKSELNMDLKTFDVETVYNPDWMAGMGTSIRAGINSLDQSTQGVLILLADQPYTTETHLKMLVDTWQNNYQKANADNSIFALATCYQSFYGVPALFDKCAFNDLCQLEGDQGARILLNMEDKNIEGFEPDFPLIDIDTTEQLAALQKSDADV